jgi:hypothetical protein
MEPHFATPRTPGRPPMKASMRILRTSCGISIVAAGLAAAAPSALAQEITFTSPCSIVGNAAPEPLGDREGHAIFIEEDICRFDSGPFAGGVMTASSTWEFDKANAALVSSSAIFRNPGVIAVGRLTEGKIALTITDGKVTGVTSWVRGIWPITTGSASSLAGKSFTATGKDTGPGQFVLEYKVAQ